ncbi:MAG: acylneuraminate cytidylyltransferase family protein, partial [Candidatus Omnitrophota bacterium]
MNIVIIPARGGSKGILNKNIINILGKPLIVWSIEAAINASLVNKIFVTTDDNAIADIAKNAGAEIIMRPFDLAADNSTSESALIHAIDALNDRDIYPKNIIFLQATSPVREPGDIDNAMKIFIKEQLDSLFSCCKVRDRFLWEKSEDSYKSINYDFNDRQRRQDITPKYLENGSIYIFKP